MEEKYSFAAKIADLSVKISCRYDFCFNLCKDYIIKDEGKYDIIARATDKEIEDEMENARKNGENPTPAGAETACIHRSLANALPLFSRAVFHGAAISYKQDGLLFTAQSGTGKTTHIKLWRECFGEDVRIVNGDKPVLKAENGTVTVYGTPWAGKENWQKNRSVKLKAICAIERGKENRIEKISRQEALAEFMNRIYLPPDPSELSLTLSLLDKIINTTPVYRLFCNISKEAAHLSFKTMIGE